MTKIHSVGFDVGFAWFGVAWLECDRSTYTVRHWQSIETDRGQPGDFAYEELENRRRVNQITAWLDVILDELPRDNTLYAYEVFGEGGMGKHANAMTQRVLGRLEGWVAQRTRRSVLEVFEPIRPAEVKALIPRKAGPVPTRRLATDKGSVGRAVLRLIAPDAPPIELPGKPTVRKSSHAWDAAGVAICNYRKTTLRANATSSSANGRGVNRR